MADHQMMIGCCPDDDQMQCWGLPTAILAQLQMPSLFTKFDNEDDDGDDQNPIEGTELLNY